MKLKAICFLVISLCFTSCTGQNAVGPDATDPDVAELAGNQAGAYFAVFETLYETDPALNADSAYLALDLTNVMLEDTEPLIVLMQDFCDDNGYTFLLDTIDALTEKGYIKDLYFEEGFVITFSDIQLDSNTLVTSAMKWRSGLGAIGADYTVEQSNGTWEITEMSNNWIS